MASTDRGSAALAIPPPGETTSATRPTATTLGSTRAAKWLAKWLRWMLMAGDSPRLLEIDLR
ncbi:MAG: hypothetical protein ACKO6B_09445, partial [Planctomycetia bacterium]